MSKRTHVLVAATAALATSFAVVPALSASAVETMSLDRTIHDRSVTQSSGLARSTYDREVLWTHNDHGDSPRIFAIGRNGQTRARVHLRGASNVDFEDMSTGRGHSLWVADSGASAGARSVIDLYRLREPQRLQERMRARTARFQLRFPDGAHDAQAMAVHPETGRIYVVTTKKYNAGIYTVLNPDPDKVNRLQRIADAPAHVTGASFSPDGSLLALSTPDQLYTYDTVGGSATVQELPTLRSTQSVEVTRGGDEAYVGSEGTESPIYRVQLRRGPKKGGSTGGTTDGGTTGGTTDGGSTGGTTDGGSTGGTTGGTTDTSTKPAGTYELERTITDALVTESSGLARSHYDGSVLWTHNDSGDRPRIYAVSKQGTVQATVTLGGASARDWEDMAAGPNKTLWVGDIGDNAEGRASIQVYRITEPQQLSTQTVQATAYTFRYEDGPHNAETLMVHPTTGRVYVVTKNTSGGDGGIYEAPSTLSTSSTNVLRKIGTVVGRITAGDFAPDGTTFMIRTQIRGYLYDSLSDTSPEVIPLPDMPQGESLTFAGARSAVLLGSERANSPVYTMWTGLGDGTSGSTSGSTSGGTSGGTDQPATYSGLSWQPQAPAVPTNGVVRPEEFGAVGDGVKDDSAALQNAVDRAAEIGAKVELGSKTYRMDSRLMLPSKTYLYGKGTSSVLKFTWEHNDSTHDGLYIGNKSSITGNTDITLDNFAIKGAADGLPAGLNATHTYPKVPAIRFRLVDRFRITRLDISNAPGISLLNQGCTEGLIDKNTVHHSGRDGINTGWFEKPAYHVLVADNDIYKIGDDGVALLGANAGTYNDQSTSHDIAAVNNRITGWETNVNGQALGRGIAVINAKNAVVLGNTITRTHSAGVLVAPSIDSATGTVYRSSDVSINNNAITDAGQLDSSTTSSGRDGLLVKRADRISSSTNTIVNPRDKTIAVYDCNACSVNG